MTNASCITIDLTVDPQNPLYAGVNVKSVSGRNTIVDDPQKVVDLVTRNATALIAQQRADGVVLTGGAPIYVYLSVFHVVVHLFGYVAYSSATDRVLVCSHGKLPDWAS